jgi:hypothetical protein
MTRKHQSGIGPSGRWLIFAGIPMAVNAILFAATEAHHNLEHAVGEKFLPYVLFFTPVVIVTASKLLYDHFPKSLMIPVGVAGWILALSVLYWFFWFGPGALKIN